MRNAGGGRSPFTGRDGTMGPLLLMSIPVLVFCTGPAAYALLGMILKGERQ